MLRKDVRRRKKKKNASIEITKLLTYVDRMPAGGSTHSKDQGDVKTVLACVRRQQGQDGHTDGIVKCRR